MPDDRWRRVGDIFDAVVSAPAADRQRILAAACGGDASLQSEIESLLAVHESGRSLLDEPPGWHVQPGDVLCDRFVVICALGKGGMGEVWAAKDRQLNETVAIKTVRSYAIPSDTEVDRFKREIQLARRIAHPNVCRIHELFEDRSGPFPRLFLTMELIEGETLAARLARERAVPVPEALALIQQVIAGLAAAHAVNVVHRDLKPANVMLTTRAGRGLVVMDFGLARVFDPASTGDTTRSPVTAVVGTPQYMAPEQIAGGMATARTDIYAIGLLLYEILRGERPFGDGTMESWLRRAREKPARLSGLVPGVGPRIDDVIARCLEYEPGRRFRSVEEVWAALDRRPISLLARRRSLQIAAATAAVATVALFWRFVDWQDTTPGPDALRAHADAVRELAEGASVRALNSVTRALETSPQFPAAQALRAEILLELEMPARAQEAMLMATASGATDTAHADYMSGMQQLVLRNCDTALPSLQRYAQGGPPADQPYRLLSLSRGLERCGRPEEAHQALASAATADPRNAAVAIRQARLFALQPDYAKANEALDRAEKLFRERTNSEGLCEVLVARGTLQAVQDDLERAAETLSKARETAESLADVRQQVRVRLQMAIVNRKRGDLAAAERLTSEAVELARRNSLETLTLEGLFANGNVHLVQNQFPKAQDLFEHARAIAETNRHEQYLARADLTLASLYVRVMEPAKAEKAAHAARAYFERAGQTRNVRAADILFGEILTMRAAYPAARLQFEGVIASAARANDREQEIRGRENLATTLSLLGRFPEALAEYQAVLAIHRESKRARSESFALLNISDTLAQMGRFTEAAAAIRDAQAGLPPAAEIQSTMLWVQASNAYRSGNYEAALSHAQRSIIVGAGLSDERTAHASVIACAARMRLRISNAANRCATVLPAESLTRNVRLWLEIQLVDAEMRLSAGTSSGVAEQLAAVLAVIDRAQSHAERWRSLALLVRTRSGTSKVQARANLDQELADLRTLWGDAIYRSWRRRADVTATLSLPATRRGEN